MQRMGVICFNIFSSFFFTLWALKAIIYRLSTFFHYKISKQTASVICFFTLFNPYSAHAGYYHSKPCQTCNQLFWYKLKLRRGFHIIAHKKTSYSSTYMPGL